MLRCSPLAWITENMLFLLIVGCKHVSALLGNEVFISINLISFYFLKLCLLNGNFSKICFFYSSTSMYLPFKIKNNKQTLTFLWWLSISNNHLFIMVLYYTAVSHLLLNILYFPLISDSHWIHCTHFYIQQIK